MNQININDISIDGRNVSPCIMADSELKFTISKKYMFTKTKCFMGYWF